ncbi:hypothetical protein D3C85_693430 [compost metagenome]
MKDNYVIVVTDEYGERFIYVQPIDGQTLWFVDDAQYQVECLETHPKAKTLGYTYKVARLSFLD